MVDESQDTNLKQWQIIHICLRDFFTSDHEKKQKTLFVVGDPKQSIYSFQGTYPELFQGPGYNADLRFELMKGDDTYFVKVTYNNKPLSVCGSEFCQYDKFKEKMANYEQTKCNDYNVFFKEFIKI